MRSIFVCIAALVIVGCKAQIPPSLDKDPVEGEIKLSQLKELSYKRQSRAGNSLTTIGPKQIVIYKASKKPQSFVYPASEWDSLALMVQGMDMAKLAELKAPTNKRLYDGAAASTLRIVIGKNTYVSSTFDDGYPPDEISDLIFKLLSLEESVLNN